MIAKTHTILKKICTLSKKSFPHICLNCEKEIDSEIQDQSLCEDCHQQCLFFSDKKSLCPTCLKKQDGFLESCQDCLESPPLWSQFYSIGEFSGPYKQLIYQFKYGKKTGLSPWFLQQTDSEELSHFLQDCELISFVPMHFLKQAWRGYNQAELIAREIAKKHQLTLSPLLSHRFSWKSQAKMRKKSRLKNSQQVFQGLKKENMADKVILLVDDIYTTGSTLRACSEILLKQGAASVKVLTIARG